MYYTKRNSMTQKWTILHKSLSMNINNINAKKLRNQIAGIRADDSDGWIIQKQKRRKKEEKYVSGK